MIKKINLEHILLSIFLILGFIVRLYRVDNPIADWHSWRQADTASVSRIFVEKGIDLLHPKYHDISSIQTGIFNPEGYRMVEFPIYNALHAALFNAFDKFSLEKLGRMLTAFIATLTGFFIFLLGKKHYSAKVGLLASFFYMFLPFNIYFTRVVLPDPLGVLFAVSGLYFFGINFAISGILFALSFLQKPFFAIYLFPLIPQLIKKENIKNNLAFLFLAFTPFIIWRAWISQFPEGIPFYTWAFNGDKIRFHPAFFRWIVGERIGILILGAGGVAPFVFGLTKKLENKFNLYFILGAITYLTVVATANVRHDYYQILIIPMICMSLAIGSVYLWKRSKIVLSVSLIVMFLIGWDRIKPFYQINHPELMEVGSIVDAKLPKDAEIVIPYNGDTAFLYQTKRRGWPAVDDSIENIIERGADYYVSIDLGSADTVNFQKKFATFEKTDRYIILDLHKPLKTQK